VRKALPLANKSKKKKIDNTVSPLKIQTNKTVGWFLIFAVIILSFFLLAAPKDSYVFTDRHGLDLVLAISLAIGGYIGRNILHTIGLSVSGLLLVVLSFGIHQFRANKPGVLKREILLSLCLFFSTLITGGLVDSSASLILGGLGGKWGKDIVGNFSHSIGHWFVILVTISLWLFLICFLFRININRILTAVRIAYNYLRVGRKERKPVLKHKIKEVSPAKAVIPAKSKAPETARSDPSLMAQSCRARLKTTPKYRQPSLEKIIQSADLEKSRIIDSEILKKLDTQLVEMAIKADILEIHTGPILNQVNLKLKSGQRMKGIQQAINDLSVALGGSVKLVKSDQAGVVGLEIPNKNREIVTLSELFKKKHRWKVGLGLEIPLALNTIGEPYWIDLSEMPHLLIAGTTGSGKSVFLNSLILSLLYLYPPNRLRLAIVDPKIVELLLMAYPISFIL